MKFEQIDNKSIRATAFGGGYFAYTLLESGTGAWDLVRSREKIGAVRQSGSSFRATVVIGSRNRAADFPTRDEAFGRAVQLCEWRREKSRQLEAIKRMEKGVQKLEHRVSAGLNEAGRGWDLVDFDLPNVDDDLKIEILKRRIAKLRAAIEAADIRFEQDLVPMVER